LRARIPFCATGNPIDVTGQVTADLQVLALAAQGAIASGCYDALVFFVAATLASPRLAPAIVQIVRETLALAPGRLPITLCGIADAATRRALLDAGCLVFEEPTHAIEVLAAKARWRAHLAEAPALPEPLAPPPAVLNEVEAMEFLSAHGIPCAPHRLARSADEAVQAWNALGGQAVLKIVSADLLHKSDVGGVRVGLRSEAEVREGYDAILDAVARQAPEARRQGVLVARRLDALAELMLGARHDSVFGTMVVLGLGGVAVELHAKTTVLTAPTTAARVHAALAALGILPLLGGWRGRPAVDSAALVHAVLRFAALAAALGPRLGTLEINPLMVTTDGVAAADAVLSFVQ
jgi:acyl-CoA synthetase (NDP forming)